MDPMTTHWYRIRIPNASDLIVRDDTGEPPEQWGAGGLRHFPVAVAMVPEEKSKHNHAPSGAVRLMQLGPSWLNLAVFNAVAVPVSALEPDNGLVRDIERMLSRVAVATAAEVAEVAGPPRLVSREPVEL